MLLALQLVLGLQLQTARAVASPMPMHEATHGVSSHAMPSHEMSLHTAVDDHGAAKPACPQHSVPHDCCHASSCQCQCVYTPGAIAVPALAYMAASIVVPSPATTQFVAPRVDEFLRPPIA